MVTCDPTGPVVADTPVIAGAGLEVELTDTLSNVAVARFAVLPFVVTNPTYTFCAMVIVWLAPSCTQLTPSMAI
jgi:hypothetical protein